MVRISDLTVEDLLRIMQSGALLDIGETQQVIEFEKKQTKKRKSRKDPKMKKALRESNAKLRNKNGKLKKGKTQSDIMKLAHRLRRKMK